jgi:hypothetical protein
MKVTRRVSTGSFFGGDGKGFLIPMRNNRTPGKVVVAGPRYEGPDLGDLGEAKITPELLAIWEGLVPRKSETKE